MPVEYAFRFAKGLAPFWAAVSVIALTAGGILTYGCVSSDNGASYLFLALIPIAMSCVGIFKTFNYWFGRVQVALSKQSLRVTTVAKMDIISIGEVRKVIVHRVGVNRIQGPDSIPRYGVAVRSSYTKSLARDLSNEDALSLGKVIAMWANAELVNAEEEYLGEISE